MNRLGTLFTVLLLLCFTFCASEKIIIDERQKNAVSITFKADTPIFNEPGTETYRPELEEHGQFSGEMEDQDLPSFEPTILDLEVYGFLLRFKEHGDMDEPAPKTQNLEEHEDFPRHPLPEHIVPPTITVSPDSIKLETPENGTPFRFKFDHAMEEFAYEHREPKRIEIFRVNDEGEEELEDTIDLEGEYYDYVAIWVYEDGEYKIRERHFWEGGILGFILHSLPFAIGFILLAIGVIVLICCCRRKSKGKNKPQPSIYVETTSVDNKQGGALLDGEAPIAPSIVPASVNQNGYVNGATQVPPPPPINAPEPIPPNSMNGPSLYHGNA